MLRFKKSKMLCLAGFTPVAKVDHATGESAGNVVRSRRKLPWSLRRARLGSRPSARKRSVRLGSSPSRPRKISLRMCARRKPCRRRASRHNTRKGQKIRENRLRRKPVMSVRKEPRKAKPAPGPTYASCVCEFGVCRPTQIRSSRTGSRLSNLTFHKGHFPHFFVIDRPVSEISILTEQLSMIRGDRDVSVLRDHIEQ